ncbi:MAG TPA: TadE/TadG family type IV pilus assembly protein [Anaeromyxobacteraceae bacterium]|nr:TadE/TadG family type IV pilus assembly protein [Anaeromyxobacteraceae bacterium]
MRRRRGPRSEAGQRGAAAVEFALVLPLLLMLVLGAIDWGWYFFVREVVTNAAREGARAGAVASAADPTQTARDVAANYLTTSGLTRGAAPMASTATATIGGTTVTTVNVVVTYPVGSLTGFTLVGHASMVPAQVQAQAQMRREGT